MAKRSTARERALAEAKANERRAGKKVSRNEAKGINVSGSTYDPRLGARNLDSLSTNELKAHNRRLVQFTSRDTQFVSLFAGSPAPRQMWEQYKRLEAKNNERAAAFLAKYGDQKLPEQDLTISGRIKMTTPEQRANNQGRVHEQINRAAKFINGVDQLEKLTEQMRKKARGDYTSDAIGRRLNSGDALLKYSGNADLIKVVRGLTLEQKQLLIDASTFFDIAVENFNSPDKSEVTMVKDAYYEEHEGVSKDVHVREALEQQLNWVREIAPRGGNTGTGGGAGTGKSTRSSNRNSRRRKAR